MSEVKPVVEVFGKLVTENGSFLGCVRDMQDGKWVPVAIMDQRGNDLPLPMFGLKEDAAKALDDKYVSMLFNELHRMLAHSSHTPEGMMDEIDRAHHDYNIAVHMDRQYAQPDGPPCRHVKEGGSLKYVAHYAAPGMGSEYKCVVCGESFSVIGTSVYHASEGAHIMTEEDVI